MTRNDESYSHIGRMLFTDPPRPFDVILAGYNVAYRYFPDIHCLEQNGARLPRIRRGRESSCRVKEKLGTSAPLVPIRRPEYPPLIKFLVVTGYL